eukprot:SAG22_NODE_1078_length_5677_cov_5.105952_2_plen_163_part_00
MGWVECEGLTDCLPRSHQPDAWLLRLIEDNFPGAIPAEDPIMNGADGIAPELTPRRSNRNRPPKRAAHSDVVHCHTREAARVAINCPDHGPVPAKPALRAIAVPALRPFGLRAPMAARRILLCRKTKTATSNTVRLVLEVCWIGRNNACAPCCKDSSSRPPC